MDGRDKSREEQEHGSLQDHNSQSQKEGESAEIAAEEEDIWRRGLVVSGSPSRTPEDELTSSPVAKRVNFSPMSSPRVGQRCASLSPSSSSSRNKSNSLKKLIPKLSFKNRSSNSNNFDIEKAFASSPSSANDRDRFTTWTLSNILTPRLKKTESLPVTPVARSNPESMNGRYVVDHVTSMKKGPLPSIHRSRCPRV